MDADETNETRRSAAMVYPDLASVALWLSPVILIVYLALHDGGFGIVERGEVGIAVWWAVLVGAVVGALPARASVPRSGIALFVILVAFTAWTTLSFAWTESDERTAIEVARLLGYLGVLALALLAQSGERWRALLGGVVFGSVVVLTLAVLSRLQPTWFPEQVAGDFFPGVQLERRLAYPLNYSTGVAALAAMTVPMLLSVTVSARYIAVRALSAVAVSVALLTLWLTASSLTIPLGAVALVFFFVLTADRLSALATMLVTGAATLVLIACVEARDALDNDTATAAAQSQGDEMTLLLLIVCVVVGAVQAALSLLGRRASRPAWMRPSAAALGGLAAVIVLSLAVALLAPPLRDTVSDGWEKFRGPSELDEQSSSRLQEVLDPSSRGRYQFWESAMDAGASEPLTGIGAGSFEFWWARNREAGGFARDAHSLFIETYAELGVVGFLLIGGFAFAVVGLGFARTMRAPPAARAQLAGATSAVVVFVAAAAVDWMWELAVLPVIFVLLAAIVVYAGRCGPVADAKQAPSPRLGIVSTVAVALASLAAAITIAVPLSSATAIQDSQAEVAEGNLAAALSRADDAIAIEPFAASAQLQRALVLELAEDFPSAAAAAREATTAEPTNWRTWLVLSRLLARAGDARGAVAAYRQARSLNPLSPLFAR